MIAATRRTRMRNLTVFVATHENDLPGGEMSGRDITNKSANAAFRPNLPLRNRYDLLYDALRNSCAVFCASCTLFNVVEKILGIRSRQSDNITDSLYASYIVEYFLTLRI